MPSKNDAPSDASANGRWRKVEEAAGKVAEAARRVPGRWRKVAEGARKVAEGACAEVLHTDDTVLETKTILTPLPSTNSHSHSGPLRSDPGPASPLATHKNFSGDVSIKCLKRFRSGGKWCGRLLEKQTSCTEDS